MSEIEKIPGTLQSVSDVDPAHDGGATQMAFKARRRQLAKLGFGAPVLASLASRPVFAGQCLSNMMSGNLSPGHIQGKCSTGWSPGGWGQPGGNVHIYSTVGAWKAINLLYGDLKLGGKDNKYDDYTGGATLANVPAVLNKDGIVSTTLLREVLTSGGQLGQLTRHFVCAYFNAKLSGLARSSFTYILSTQQVLDMETGKIAIPKGAPGYPGNFNDFFNSTWG